MYIHRLRDIRMYVLLGTNCEFTQFVNCTVCFVDSQFAQFVSASVNLYDHKIYLVALRTCLKKPHRVKFWLQTLGSHNRWTG